MVIYLTNHIANLDTQFGLLFTKADLATQYLEAAALDVGWENWGSAKTNLDACSQQLAFANTILTGPTTGVRAEILLLFNWINANWGGGGGVSMDDILSTMLGASFEQLQKFIGIADAYRVAIWNAPFNTEFYAALARGFTKWP